MTGLHLSGMFDTLKSLTKNAKGLPTLIKAGKEAVKAGGATAIGAAGSSLMADKNVAKQLEQVQTLAIAKAEEAGAQGVFDKVFAFWKAHRIPVVIGGVVVLAGLGWTVKRAFFGKK